MPRPLDIRSTVEEGHVLPVSHRKAVQHYLKLYEVGDEVQLILKKPDRSTAANKYYWGVVIKMIQQGAIDAGLTHSAEALHSLFKQRHLTPVVEEVNGESVAYLTTTKLDSTQFFDFVEAVRYDEYTLSLGVVIPDPDKSYRSYSIQDKPIS